MKKITVYVILLGLLFLQTGCTSKMSEKENLGSSFEDSVEEMPEESWMNIELGTAKVEIRKHVTKFIIDSFEFFAFENNGHYIAVVCKGMRITGVLDYSSSGELLSSSGIIPIEIANVADLVGASSKSVTDQYGDFQFDLGSGRYIPAYITTEGVVLYFSIEEDTVLSVSALNLIDNSTEVYGERDNIVLIDE